MSGFANLTNSTLLNWCCLIRPLVSLPAEPASALKHGVYAVNLYIKDREFWGITNVGVNPTVEKGKNVKIETYIFNFDGSEIYGFDIRIKFIEFIRSEMKFDSIDDLKNQIDKDKKYVLEKYL